MSRIGNSIECRLVAARAGGTGNGEGLLTSTGLVFWSAKNVPELVLLTVQLREYTKFYFIVHFQRMNFMVWELYLNI